MSLGETETGLALLERVLQADENNRAAIRLKVLALYRKGDKDEALKLVNQFLVKNSDDDEFRYMKAVFDRPAGSDPETIERDLIGAIKDPFTRNMQLAGWLHNKKEFLKEIEALSTLAVSDDRDRTLSSSISGALPR